MNRRKFFEILLILMISVPLAGCQGWPASTPAPTQVQLIAPQDSSELPKLGRVSFTWEAFPAAAGYRVELTLPGGEQVAFNKDGTQIERAIESFPWEGDYTWRVVAFDADGNELAASPLRRFSKPQSPCRSNK